MPARPVSISICTSHTPSFSSKTSPFSPLPSELPRTPINGHFASLKSHDEAIKTPITPPTAYTDFLKNTVNSPAIASPRHSFLHSPASAGPYRRHSYGYYTPATPYPAPVSATAKRIKLPASPAASVGSPESASSGSPSEDDVEGEVKRSGNHRQVTVKQIVTTTVTYSTPRMSLMPAPKGKRKRID